MKGWIESHRGQRCVMSDDGEDYAVAVFDWDELPGRDTFVNDLFGDADAGDFDGVWTGDRVDDALYVPFALLNCDENVCGDELEGSGVGQFDGLLLYRRGDGDDPEIYAIDVDGTAIPSAGLEALGRLSGLQLSTKSAGLSKGTHGVTMQGVNAALKAARKLWKTGARAEAIALLESELDGMPVVEHEDFDLATEYGACFVMRGAFRWDSGDHAGALEDWAAAVEVGRSSSYADGAVLYIVGALLAAPERAFVFDDELGTAVAMPAKMGRKTLKTFGLFDSSAVGQALDSTEGRASQVAAVRAWLG